MPMDTRPSPADMTPKVLALGKVLGPELVEATTKLYAPLHSPTLPPRIETHLDLAYGSDERQKLDLFRPRGETNLPVLIYVHGGGFTAGNKSQPGSPFYGNIGAFAARNSVLGLVITYRLAPQHTYPTGADDVGAAVRWAHKHASSYSGDPKRVFLMGHSAGAAHVATYLGLKSAWGGAGDPGVAGAILASGIYNMTTLPQGPNKAYYGEDASKYAERSSVAGVKASKVPLMIAVAEYDPPQFEAQSLELVTEVQKARQQMPRFLRVSGHNHISIMHHIGTNEKLLGNEILDFVFSGR